MKYHVLTVVSDPYKARFVKYLWASCRFFEIPLEIRIAPQSYTSHLLKDQMLIDFLNTIPANDFLIFADGYDSFFMSSLDELVSKFEKMNKEAVFSTEMTCWPDASLKSNYFPKGKLPDSPYRYLNCGGFIGSCGFLKTMLQMPIRSRQHYPSSNQYCWTIRYMKNMHNIGLDHNCEIFLALAPSLNENNLYYKETAFTATKEVDFYHPKFLYEGIPQVLVQIDSVGKRIRCKKTESTPCHIHLNGSIGNHVLKSGMLDKWMPWLSSMS